MSLSLTIGSGDPLSLDSLTDLKNDAQTFLKLGQEFELHLTQPVSSLPGNLKTTAVQFASGNQAWTPGPITFTLSGGVSGRVSVVTGGDLLAYTGQLPTQVQAGIRALPQPSTSEAIQVPAGKVYVCLELDFLISGGISGNYAAGVYGVSTANRAVASISVAYYSACDPGMPLQAAIQQAFQGFVLPLHADTITNLRPGDYLHHTFNASLQLGLGASLGFDKVFYAGQYKVDIPKTAGAVKLNAAVKPEIQGGAKLAFAYDYTGSFEVLLSRETADTARLHLFRSQQQDLSLGVQLGATLTAGADVSARVLQDKLASTLTQALPDELQSPFSKYVLTPAFTQVQKYVGELNSRIGSWLTRVNDQKCSLDLALDRVNDRFLLTDYTIDLTQVYQPAWKHMVEGRFVDALALAGSGVSLTAGSGLECVFNSTASINLNLFGALTANWNATTISNASLVYVGNKTFHLITEQGRELLTTINGARKEIDIYFAAEVDLKDSDAILPAVNLHVVLQATNDPKFGEYIAKITGLLSSGPAGAALAANVEAIAALPGSVETLHLVFAPSTYSKLQASTLIHGKPVNEALDQPNYDAFADACGLLFKDAPANFTWQGRSLTYAIWRENNIASNDEWPARQGALPDRTSSAGYNPSAAAQLGSIFPSVGSVGNLIFYCFFAAAQFMDLCDDLLQLANQTTLSLDHWTDFVKRLQNIMKKDVNPYFLAPSALALAKRCGGVPATISGPVPNLPAGSSIAVTMTYQ